MDLSTVTEVLIARDRAALSNPRAGDAFLAGGTQLYGQPADDLRRLIDLSQFGWTPLVVHPGGMEIAATCTVAELLAFPMPAAWQPGGVLVADCCHAFLASFKIWNRGTVGGNICVSYPAGPMISLATATDGQVLIWRPDGTEFALPVTGFVMGDAVNVLEPGQVLRSIMLSGEALASRFAFRKLALAPLGRSSAVIIARDAGDHLALTLTASTNRPYLLSLPVGAVFDLAERIDDAVQGNWVDDVYGAADWRRHITMVLAAEVLEELR